MRREFVHDAHAERDARLDATAAKHIARVGQRYSSQSVLTDRR